MSRLILKKLVYTSPDNSERKPAVIDFLPGLNVISGPSDTGKTLIFECLNFVLGSGSKPKQPPEARGYTNLFLTVSAGGSVFTLERSILSDDIRIYKAAFDDITENTAQEIVSSHAIAPQNISKYLLDILGMNNKKLKKNESNETVSLTFNILRGLLLVDEIKIQESESPVFAGEVINKTYEKALFRFMLTGIDYSHIIKQQKPAIRRADANARIRVLGQLIEKNTLNLKKDVTKLELEDQLEKLNVSIEGNTNQIFADQREIEDLREERKAAFDTAISAESKIDQLNEIVSRFTLLTQHYQTDLDRLDAIIETGNGLALSNDVNCPLCGSEPAHHQPECVISEQEINEIKASCEREKKKINSLKGDLAKTIKQVEGELTDFKNLKESNESEYKRIDKVVTEKLEPNVSHLKNQLKQLFETKKDVEIMIGVFDQIKMMQDLKTDAENDLKAPPKHESDVPGGVQAAESGELMQKIEKNLKQWGYPNLGRISFSEVNQDITIGDKNRSEQGKGYRAITHAAFIISLMELCVEKNMPHPGFVVLDSPLVTYRGADKAKVKPDEAIPDDMKEKFYTSLSNMPQDRQAIIIENDDPPQSLIGKINYIHFTKDLALGRAGFIPPPEPVEQ